MLSIFRYRIIYYIHNFSVQISSNVDLFGTITWRMSPHTSDSLLHTCKHILSEMTRGAGTNAVSKHCSKIDGHHKALLLLSAHLSLSLSFSHSLFHLEAINSPRVNSKERPQMWTDGLCPLFCMGSVLSSWRHTTDFNRNIQHSG